MAVHRLTATEEPVAKDPMPVRPFVRAPSGARRLLLFGSAVLLPWLLACLALGRLDLPDYGAWTGIRPLEQKLRMLSAFAEAGEVDAVVLGSSVSDFGFSAELLSERLSRDLGRPYRAFNFSTGAAEVADYPELYRLVRTVARPKSVVLIVCSAHAGRSDQPRAEVPQTPVYYLSRAPVGSALNSPLRLEASRRLWNVPPVRYAAALRDLLVFGSFENLKGAGSDVYALDAHGDRISYTYERSGETLARYRDALAGFRRFSSSASPEGDPYLSREDVQGLRELARLTEADGCARMVVGHDQAAYLMGGPALPPDYVTHRRRYFEQVAMLAEAPACLVLDDVALPRHAISDPIHLNEHGAADLTAGAASCWTGRPAPPPRTYREPDLGRTDPPLTFNGFAFLLRRESPEDGQTLRLRFVRSIAVPPLPDGPLFVAVRRPDDTDLVRPALREGRDIVVSYESLSREPRQVFIGRLLTESNGQYFVLNQPLADYRWVGAPIR
jgi:hypothetical protein